MARKSTKSSLKLVTSDENADNRHLSPPSHLGDEGKSLWCAIQAQYGMDDAGGLELLRQACEAADRVGRVRRQIDEQGELVSTRDGVKAHPLCAVERDTRAALVRCLRALNLDLEPLRSRPGRPSGTVY